MKCRFTTALCIGIFGRMRLVNRLLFQFIVHNLTVPVVHNNKVYDVGFTDLCMSYDWKCYMNDHLTMLMPKHKWSNFSGKFAELADEVITNEVGLKTFL